VSFGASGFSSGSKHSAIILLAYNSHELRG
jgi:hypothetical protein